MEALLVCLAHIVADFFRSLCIHLRTQRRRIQNNKINSKCYMHTHTHSFVSKIERKTEQTLHTRREFIYFTEFFFFALCLSKCMYVCLLQCSALVCQSSIISFVRTRNVFIITCCRNMRKEGSIDANDCLVQSVWVEWRWQQKHIHTYWKVTVAFLRHKNTLFFADCYQKYQHTEMHVALECFPFFSTRAQRNRNGEMAHAEKSKQNTKNKYERSK